MQRISRIAVGATLALAVIGVGTVGTASAVIKPTETDELTVIDTDYGKALADEDGNALYVFEKDSANRSACTDTKCSTAWPAALADDDDADGPDRPSEVTAEFGTIEAAQSRADGEKQLTVNEQPLYYYALDTEPGDVKGHGVAPGGAGTTWYLVGTDGRPLATADDSGGY